MFKNMLKNKWGYVTIETVIVAGLVVALGAYALTEFYATAQEVIGKSIYNAESPFRVVHTTTGGFEEVEL